MPMSADPKRGAEYRRAKELARLKDVTPEWMDEMTTRVFNEIRRQIEQIEKCSANNAALYAANARTLASLQHTLGEALRMKRDREARQETKDSKKDGNNRKNLYGKMARLVAGEKKRSVSPAPQRG